jgi:hypothetical protein
MAGRTATRNSPDHLVSSDHFGFYRMTVLRFLAVLLVLLSCGAARAQTSPADTAQAAAPSRADTTATPAIAPLAGGAASVPSTEFETYNASGRGLRYTASLTGLYTTGTVERTFISTSQTANLAFRGGHLRLPIGLNYSYGRQSGLLKERELLLLLTPSYQRGRWKGYGLGEAGRSNLRAIDYRLVTGLGVGYTFHLDTLKNEIGLSYFALYEDTNYLTELHRQVARHSLRLKTKWTWGVLSLDALLFYQPAMQYFRTDYRVNGTAALGIRVSQHLALTGTYAYSYERISVAGRSPANGNLAVGLTYATGQ